MVDGLSFGFLGHTGEVTFTASDIELHTKMQNHEAHWYWLVKK